MLRRGILGAFCLLAVSPSSPVVATPIKGHVTGLGGVFVTSKNPKALAAWYRDVLGIEMEAWGGSILRYDAPGHPPMAIWNAMPPGSNEISPSKREFMLNFAVDDLDAFIAKLRAKGVKIINRQSDQTGKFASIIDPDGTKIELWQPPAE